MLGQAKRPAEPRLTAAQQAMLTLHKLNAKSAFVLVNLLLLLLVLYTTQRFPRKYVRVIGDCESNWMHADASEEHHEIICCDAKAGHTQWPCYPGMDLMPVLASLQGAWVIPLTALVFSYSAMMLGPSTSLPRVRVYVRRGILYLSVMALRTVVLYMGLGSLEKQVVHLVSGPSTQMCWYSSLRRSGRCPSEFDHSDHVVLLVAHYLAIPLFEWFALNVESPTDSLKRTLLRGWLLVVGALATYLLFFTASFFHTAAENLVGLLVAQLFVMTPLCLLSQDYFTSVTWLRLKNFVLPPDEVKAH